MGNSESASHHVMHEPSHPASRWTSEAFQHPASSNPDPASPHVLAESSDLPINSLFQTRASNPCPLYPSPHPPALYISLFIEGYPFEMEIDSGAGLSLIGCKLYKKHLSHIPLQPPSIRSAIKGTWWLQHDNAPSHTAFLVRDYLTQINVTVIPQPPNSPDVAPPDFFLFPYLKRALKGRHLESIDNIRERTHEG
ncbi:hypothetical protein J437_LFUL010964 [Ladona fulva]|uniref:Uncharacterized protein n=1 Tax=Ladona fulva TaxID=123851 RepID=A0A8K0KGL6_LADFU|nr:hypothetical protein J437_LFUL010964 [Ladona fulva]